MKNILILLLFPMFANSQQIDTLVFRTSVGDIKQYVVSSRGVLNAKATVATTDSMRTNIYAAINGKQASGSYATVATTDSMRTNIYAGINGKLATNGTIAESQVTGLVNDLAAKAPLTSPTLVTPVLGVATATSIAATSTVTSSGGGIGYATGAGGTVTQSTNRTTGVTINKLSGAITTNNTSLAAGAEASFTVTNSTVAIGDVIIVTARSGQTAATSIPFVTTVANGSFVITLSNFNASTADTGAMIINFVVIKCVSS